MTITELRPAPDTEVGRRDPEQPSPVDGVEAAAELRSVGLSYGANQVLREVDLSVGSREIVALIGRSGSGKSTILRLLAGLAEPDTGTVETIGHPAVAFQEPRLFGWRSVRQNVAFGLAREGVGKAQARARASATLDQVGLADKADAWPAQLSGGQAQRVSLARALVTKPRLLLLDEPFGALDALTRRSMHELLLELWRHGDFGTLLVTHDVDEALRLADRVVVLADGRIVEDVAIAHPRQSIDGDEFRRLRRDLLAALGVGDATP